MSVAFLYYSNAGFSQTWWRESEISRVDKKKEVRRSSYCQILWSYHFTYNPVQDKDSIYEKFVDATFKNCNKLRRKFMWKRLRKQLWLTRYWKDWVLNINELWQGVPSNHWDHDPPLLVMTHMVYVWVMTMAVGTWVQGGGVGRGAIPLPDFLRSVNLVSIRGPYYPHHITTRPPPPTRILRPSYGPGLWLVFGSLVRSNKLPKSNSSCSQTQVKTLSGERHLTWLAIAIDSSPWNRAGIKSTGKMALSGHP